MKVLAKLTFAIGLFVGGSLAYAAVHKEIGKDEGERQPVLLELFTSEGCSSCPPADKLLQKLEASQPVPGAQLIVLSEHVDYWNHSGWSDPFSSAVFSERQRDYATTFRGDDVYTPQLVVDGAAGLVGSNAAGARDEILKAEKQQKTPVHLTNVSRQSDRVLAHLEIAASDGGRRNALIYVALADNEQRSEVSGGENAGRSLSHVAVARAFIRVGAIGADGFSKDLVVPLRSGGKNGLRIIAVVQDRSSRRVLGVTQQIL